MNSIPSLSAFSAFLLYGPLFLATSCLAIHYLVYSRRVAQWRKSNIPFLRPSFLIGHKYFLNLTKNSCVVPIDRIYKENSDKNFVGFFLGTIPMVLIRDPALIKQVFSKNFSKTFETGMIGSRNDEVAQNTVGLCADKEKWKSTRTTLAPMYATSRMTGEAFDKIKTQIERMWADVEEAHRMGRPLDAKQVSINFLMDCASSNLFPLDTNSYEKRGELHRMAKDIFQPSAMKIVRAYAQMQFPRASMFDSLRTHGKKHIDSMANLIHQQMDYKKQHKRDENDFVDFLMRLKGAEKEEKQGTDINITNQMIGFAFASAFGGRCESADVCGGSWALHLLSLHPEYQNRIRREVARVMKKHGTSEFTYEVVQDLHFTEQCLYETTRLFPTTFSTRICSEDVQVPGTDYIFKKGESVMFNPYSIHRDRAYFKNPDEFDPNRFSPENKKTISQDTYLAFGTGPRKCPGEKRALFMLSAMVASLLHRFEIKPLSHFKQMDASDFDPKLFGNISRENILLNITPREIMAQ